MITIYQGPIEEDCETLAEMEELVRDTVVHEVGHYFGSTTTGSASSRTAATERRAP